MILYTAKEKMESFIKQKYCDSYALYLYQNGERELITSDNVNGDTYFDIASCGKVMVTSTLLLMALDKEMLSLDDTLDRFFEHVPADKKAVTVQQLLTHTSGIIRYEFPEDIYTYSHEKIAEWILSHPLDYQPGEKYVYSCNGYILLGFILEKIYRKRLDMIFEEELKIPFGMTRASFTLPDGEKNRAISHRRSSDGAFPADDENVYKMRGCAGNGAQFYTINDAVKLMDAIMKKDRRLYSEEIFQLAEKDYTPNYDNGRGLGYWIMDERFSPDEPLFSNGSFGHLGSTGTCFFLDREKDCYIILFTNFRRGIEGGMGYQYDPYMEKFAQLRTELFRAVKEDIQ